MNQLRIKPIRITCNLAMPMQIIDYNSDLLGLLGLRRLRTFMRGGSSNWLKTTCGAQITSDKHRHRHRHRLRKREGREPQCIVISGLTKTLKSMQRTLGPNTLDCRVSCQPMLLACSCCIHKTLIKYVTWQNVHSRKLDCILSYFVCNAKE